MYKKISISVVIPCYNEEAGIAKVIAEIPACVDEIIVVDNNSTDRTAIVARRLGAKVITEKTQGYGAALRTGLASATKDTIVALDGDGTYSPAYIPEMAGFMLDNKYDFVTANRFYKNHHNTLPLVNLLGNKILTFWVNQLFHFAMADSQSGMFLIKRTLFARLQPISSGMSFSEEIKLRVMHIPALKWGEFPIVYHDRSRLGKKKLRIWKDGLENLGFLLAMKFKGL